MRIHFEALFGWGIAIYAVMYLLWSAFVTYGFVEGLVPRILGLLALIAVSIVAGKSLRATTWHDILPYSLSWGIMMALFDIIMSVPFAGWYIFADWNVWFGYGIVVLAPLLSLHPAFQRFSIRIPGL